MATRAQRLEALAALKAKRTGKPGCHVAMDEEDAIYDEVSEETYQSIVRGRMMEDDFIEDDDGSGYVDHGQDEWDTHEASEPETEDEQEYYERTGRRKPKKKSIKRDRGAVAGQLDYVGRRKAREPRSKTEEAPTIESEDAFMSQLFGNLQGSLASQTKPKSARLTPVQQESPSALLARKRKQTHATALPPLQASSSSTEASSDPPDLAQESWTDDVHITNGDTSPFSTSDPIDTTAIPVSAKKLKSEPVSDIEQDDFDMHHVEAKRVSNLVSGRAQAPFQGSPTDRGDQPKLPTPSALRTPNRADPSAAVSRPPLSAKTPASNLQSWHTIHQDLESASSPRESSQNIATSSSVSCFQDDRSVHFFWFDHYEIQGTIHLFGKVWDKTSQQYVSCSVSVGGIERCVFLQPRNKMLVNGHPSDRVPGEDEVYEEFDTVRSKQGIQAWLGKWVTRKYAFELPDVPEEGQYMKVKYGFDEPQLPMDLSGATFARAFGTNTSAFELFVVKRKIMGPCWLRLEDVSLRKDAPQTWCKLELEVDDPKSVAPFSDTDGNAPKETPPLTIMSLSTRSVVNYKENKREIVAISARTWRDTSLENATPPEQLRSTSFTAVRPLGPSFPARFEQEAKQGRTKIQALKYERMVLNSFLAQVHLNDPDVILSYDFAGSNLDILLHRMRDLKCEQWAKMGRLRRTKWPVLKQGMNTRVLAGRLVCDLSSDTAKGMITSTTWSLSEMCRTYLNVQREDIDPDDIASYFDCTAPSPDRLLNFVRHCEVDAYFQMAIGNRVQLLALTKQLTNLAGNAWSRTLNGGRAERNEYILLHEFHRKKYICPDKISAWEKKNLLASKEEAGQTSHKKEKFKGGLVFEPKRGLWDRFILVMDFNSLYPSIIQEFNIDFTTVHRVGIEGEAIPDVPSSDVSQGVLPHLIATLVNRRRQVKALMKDKNAPAVKQLQWNIKQQALKLTANSMYGCLGFENSRFYARPLAALTTFKGREILTMTRDLAESMSLDVIYGDTDSVMINTNCIDYSEAIRIGHEFQRAVNEKYRLLEIDIDGVFQRMLLLQKKKYAALLVNDTGKTSTEIKGLDMKRREYCQLSKNVSSYVLDQILSGEATEIVVEKIHEYLEQVGNDVRQNKIPLEDLIIYKRLGKRPEDYPDAQNQPHVQVALRMLAKNESARSGDVIPYVFCAGPQQDTKATQAERAYHPDDVRRHAGEEAYAIDTKHYLSLQIMPPIERICECIEGTDRARLAVCLGLDANAYTAAAISDAASGRTFTPLDSQVPSTVRYAQCEPCMVRCRACAQSVTLEPLACLRSDAQQYITPGGGLVCTNSSCGQPLSAASVYVQLQTLIRSYIARYYEGVTVCSESTCQARTAQTGVYSGRCLVPACRGRTKLVYSDKELYTQLCYFAYLFDTDRALAEIGDGPQRPHVQDIIKKHQDKIHTMQQCVQQYLGRNARRYVDLRKLFAFMRM
ncbi:DNA-directed DNA polymerase [Malassezia yamatoensis]|uniref:DNA polymerase n=1 Tax=Malassezia yamatoensis TaxID=253288 RepID=A0AAJ5YRF1_9BASI|nr:DNA-directed DNA polymerase [Malassezia yamatoensis]